MRGRPWLVADRIAIRLELPRRDARVLALRPWRGRRAACSAGIVAGLETGRQATCRTRAIAITLEHEFCGVTIYSDYISSCPLWVNSRHFSPVGGCPLYTQKQTSKRTFLMSALCQ